MRPDPIALLHAGIADEEAEHRAAEGGKLGTLRGGNSGCMVLTDEGPRTIGGCARKALLRMLGIEVAEEEEGQAHSKQLMFAAGHFNEDAWARSLGRVWQGKLLRETEVPTRWETSNGTPVSGRPDIVLARNEGREGSEGTTTTPVLGLELKQLSSIFTAGAILADRPKVEHLCQAAHYSWQLGVPFDLVYISRVNWNVMAAHQPWVGRQFPRYGGRHSEWCVYKLGEPQDATPDTTYKNGKVKPGKPAKPAFYEIKRILPFVHGFNLRWVDDGTGSEGTADSASWRLEMKPSDLGDDAWQPSLITQDGIREFYESAANAQQTDALPPRPAQLDADGQRAKYDPCGYCPLAPVCDSYQGSSTKEWLKQVQG